MYSTNTNYQQDGRQQAPNVKPAPKGGHYVIHFKDVVTDTGKPRVDIYGEILQETDDETPARRVAMLLKRFIAASQDTLAEVMDDVINRNQEDQR